MKFTISSMDNGQQSVARNALRATTNATVCLDRKNKKNIFKNLSQQIFYLITLQKFKNNKYYG